MRLPRFFLFWIGCLSLSACSLLDVTTDDDDRLRKTYASRTASQTADDLYRHTLLINVGVGMVSQAVPAFHLLGLVVDAGVLVYSFDGLIYGTGAIAARDSSCPALVEKADYWQVLGAWFKGIRNSDEFTTAMGLAAVLTPSMPREQALMAFTRALNLYGAKLVGVKLAGVVTAKSLAKAMAGFVPVLGPVVAGGINWFILDGLRDAAQAYYQSKAQVMCGSGALGG